MHGCVCRLAHVGRRLGVARGVAWRGVVRRGVAWVAWRGARGVRSYLLIVNDDNDRESLIGYTHTTAGYVAVGVDDKWDPTDTNKKLQLTHTGRRFENELDTW